MYTMSQNAGIPGYAEDAWRNSKMLEYLNGNKQLFVNEALIYSNRNEAVWLFTNLRSDLIPHNEYESEVLEFAENQKKDYYIVWFYDMVDTELFSLEKLLNEYNLNELVSFSDGKILYHKGTDKP